MLWFLGFVVIFTIGGVAGVLMSVPAIDYQVHNSLFLVAHFHMMIVGGVVFGFFAGLTYWFPKIFGFRLNERLGRYAFWCWAGGFVLAFTPLYVLGLMGATRRLDHYDASLGWQPLFIVAGIGALFVALGIAFQLLQLAVSIWQREERRDLTGDPWNGRTLEWSVPSPAPAYNFVKIPVVSQRDQFWADKQAGKKQAVHYEDITLPKNTGAGIFIAGFAFLFGFGMVWHMWWLAGVGLVGVITTIIIRASDEHTEYTLAAKEVEKLVHQAARKEQYV
jgi:cytochrome o ubiquinol oxidase subunit 1